MKKLNLFGVLILGIAVLTSGCHRKPRNPTPIPGFENRGSTGDSGNNVTPGNTVPTQDVSATPITHGVDGTLSETTSDIFNKPHNEDREIFKADTVYFEFDSATVKTSEESKLQDVATYFKSHAGQALIVEGNCDERGTEKYNLSLGERRALGIREYLANLGMNPAMIKTVTFGASHPVGTGHSEESWSKNRRGDLVLVTPK